MKIEFEGQTHEFPDDFSDDDVRAALKTFDQTKPLSLGDRLSEGFDASARGLARLTGRAMSGPGFILGGLAGQVGAKDLADKMFRESEYWNQWGQQQAEKAAPAPTSMPGQVIEDVMSIVPAAMTPAAPLIFPQVLGGMTQELTQNLNEKLPLDQAARAAQIQTAANAALGPLRAAGPLKAGLFNLGAGYAADLGTSEYLKAQGQPEVAKELFDPLDPRARLVDLIAGGIVGQSGKPKKKVKTKQTDKAKSLPDPTVLAPKPDEAVGPLPAAENPEFWRQRAVDMQAEMGQPQPQNLQMVPETIQMNREGQGVNVPLNPDVAAIDAQIAAGAVTPKWPRSDLIPEGNQPEANRQAAMRDMRANLMSLQEEPTLQSRIQENVDIIDFPLRQEVLQQPEIKAAIDAFRMEAQRLQEAGDQVGLDQLTRDFTAGMQRLGIARPQDAFGRGLYEGSERLPQGVQGPPSPYMGRYLETGIRRGGERDTSLTTMPEAKGLPFGGKQPTPEETAAFRRAMAKKQGGKIHPDLLGAGAVDYLIKKVGNLGTLAKFKGTFDIEDLRTVLEELKANVNARLVWMSPDEFHQLAAKRSGGYEWNMLGEAVDISENKRNQIRQALKTETGIKAHPNEGITPSLPTLWVKKALGNYAEVYQHDGRHRMDVLKEQGIEKVPVLLFDDGRTKFNYSKIIGQGLDPYMGDFPPAMDLPLDKLPGTKPKFIPKDLRGGAKGTWNPYDTKQEIQRLANELLSKAESTAKSAVTKVKDTVDIRQGVFNKLGITGVNLIGKAPSFEEAKPSFVSAPDTGPAKRWVPGAVAKAEMNANNPIVLWAHRQLDNGSKTGQYLVREWVRPVEDMVKPLLRNKDNLLAMHEIFMKEMRAKTRYTESQLSQYGIDPEIIKGYQAMRDMYDKIWKIVNEARKSRGMKELPPEDAYFSARFSGPWKIEIYERNADGSKGKTLWYIAEGTKWKAKAALKHLQDKGLLNGLETSELRYSKGEGDSPFRATYSDLVDLLGRDDPRVVAIREAWEAADVSVDVDAYEKHFKRKTGVRGFVGDRPWEDPITDAREAFIQQFQYAKNAVQWAAYQPSMAEIKKLLSDTDLKQSHKNALSFVEYYTKHHAGLQTNKAFHEMENLLAKGLGINTKGLEFVVGTTKGGFYVHTLGLGNLPFTITQVVQPIFTSAKHADFSNQGYSHDIGRTILEGGLNANLALLSILNKWGAQAHGYDLSRLADAAYNKMDPVFKDAHDYVVANGLIDINPTSDITDLRLPPGVSKAIDWGAWNVVQSEKVARISAFMGFVSHLKQSGKFPDTAQGRLEMFRMAEEATNFTMVDFRPSERAGIFDEMGLAGHTLNTFTAFKINQLAQMAVYSIKAADGLKTGNFKDMKPLIYMTTIMWALGGLSGFLGVEDADALLEALKIFLRKTDPSGVTPEFEKFSIKGEIMKNPDWISVGPVSSTTGVNLYTRFNQSDIIPFDPTSPGQTVSSLIPPAAFTWNTGSAILDLMSGNAAEQLAAGYKLSPPSLRGLYEEYVPGMKSGEVSLSPTTLKTGSYRRSEEESTIRKTGFRSTKESLEREKDFRAERMDARSQERRNKIANDVKTNLIFGKFQDLEKATKLYYKWGGDVDTLLSDADIERRIIEMNLTQKERLTKAAESGRYPAVKALLERLNQ